jgi:predicted RND superfamily exporter protein
LEKFGSFCFACVGLCDWGKTKCAKCVSAIKLKNKKERRQKNKTSLRWLVCLAVSPLVTLLSQTVCFITVVLNLHGRHRVSANLVIEEVFYPKPSPIQQSYVVLEKVLKSKHT